MTVLAMAVVSGGAAFLAIGIVGLFRLPNFYTRAHAVGMMEGIGIMLVLAGLALHEGISWMLPRIVVIILFAIAGNTTAVHVILRAARHEGVRTDLPRKP